MDTLFHKIGSAVVGAMMFVASFFGVTSDSPAVGTTIPVVVAVFQTSLASSISTSDTSMTLVTGTDKAGNSLSGYMCFNIDEGTSVEEFVCGTASSTSVTGMIRGIDPVDGVSEVTALKKRHGRGASVKITNYPQLAVVSRALNGTVSIPNKLWYGSTLTFSSSTEIVTKGYVDGVAIAGAPIATTLVQGIARLSTASASSTDPIVVGDNDTRVPTQSENDALAGSNGSPSSSNKYLTETDATSTTAAASRLVRYTSTGQITATSTPSASTDATSKGYVDGLVNYNTLLFATTTNNTGVGGSTEFVLGSSTLIGNVMGQYGSIRARIPFLATTDTASSHGFRIKIGGTTVASTSITATTNSGTIARYGYIEMYVQNNASATANQIYNVSSLSVYTTVNETANPPGSLTLSAGTTTIDTTATSTFQITMQDYGNDGITIYPFLVYVNK